MTRDTVAVLGAITALCLAPKAANGQEMTFAAETPTTRVHVVMRDAGALEKGDQRAVVDAISDAVRTNDAFELVEVARVKRALGKRGWRTFRKCTDVDCVVMWMGRTEVDQLILITARDAGTTLDIELSDAVTGRAIRVVEIAVSPGDISGLGEAVVTLLSPGSAERVRSRRRSVVVDTPSDVAVTETHAAAPGASPWVWASAGGGVALIAAGAFFGLAADNTQADIQATPHDRSELDDLTASGERSALLANVCYGLGAAGVLTGLALHFFNDPETPSVVGRFRATPTSGGAFVGFEQGF